MKGHVCNISQLSKTLQYLTVPGYLCHVIDEPRAWYRRYIQFSILFNWPSVGVMICSPMIRNIENIVITELRIRFLPPDLTPVQSEMVELGVLGYSRTQHAEWYDDGVLSESGYCHLGQMKLL